MTKRKEQEHFPEVNQNGSLLNPDTVTICNDCNTSEAGKFEQCKDCGSTNVEHIEE